MTVSAMSKPIKTPVNSCKFDMSDIADLLVNVMNVQDCQNYITFAIKSQVK